MRRKYFGLAMATIATLGPVQAFGGDREIAQSIIQRLKISRDEGQLKNFTLDMKVDEGVVLFRGKISGEQQRSVVLASSEGLEGIREIVDELEILETANVAKAAPTVQAKPAKIFRPASMKLATAAEAKAPAPVQPPTPVKKPAPQATESTENGFNFAQALASPADKMESGLPEAVVVDLPFELPTPTEVAAVEPAPVVAEVELDQVAEAAPVKMDAVETKTGVKDIAVSPIVDVAEELAVAPTPAADEFAQEVVPGIVLPTAAFDGKDGQDQTAQVPVAEVRIDDHKLTQSVIRAISNAKSQGHVKNFGVDVNSYDGIIELEGNAASEQQREFLEMIARHAPGARGVRNLITVQAPMARPTRSISAQPVAHRQGEPRLSPIPRPAQPSNLQPLPSPNQANMAAMRPTQGHMGRQPVPTRQASYGNPQTINGEMVVPGSIVNHDSVPGAPYGAPAVGGAPVMGQPVPMAPAAAVGAPRYDSPNLPNYAWPGYAAHPNYAALSYPQQYSPSAFPFIGPFYPYPQVPLGWRKVSLEWDDGWWFLDFTDK